MYLRLELPVDARKVLAALLIVESVMLVVDTLISCCQLASSPYLVALLDITQEANLPTWFSSTQAMVTGVLALNLALRPRMPDEAASRAGWYVIGLFFLYLGMDDASQLHERLASYLSDQAAAQGGGNWLVDRFIAFGSYYWQFIFVPLFGLLAAYMAWFLFRTLRHWRWFMVFAGGMACYVLAVMLDYVEGIDRWVEALSQLSHYPVDQTRHLLRAVEEYIEMVGTTLILFVVLQHQLTPSADGGTSGSP